MNNTAAELDWQRTSPIAVVFFLLRAVRQFVVNGLPAVVVGVASYTSGGDTLKSFVLAGIVAFVVLMIISSGLSWLRFRFCVRDGRVLVRRGVLHQEELSVEFDRIQNISIREPVYMRPFSLVLLSIDTAGSGQKEIILGGIQKSIAIKLREAILSRPPGVADVTPDKVTSQSDQSLLISRSTRDIVIYGLTVNFMLWLLIAIGAFFGAHDVTENLLEWLSTREYLQVIVGFFQKSGGDLQGNILMLLGLFLLVFLLLPLISVLGALFRYHGYRLAVEGETYRRNSGLLSRHDESLKRHKIQAIVLKQNFVARFFKRTNMQLRVASAGSAVETGNLPTGPKSTFLVPALHDFEVKELCTEFFPGCDFAELQFSRINRRRLTQVMLSITLVPLLLPTLLLSLLVSWKFLVLLPLGMAIAWSVVTRVWQKTGYAVVGEYGFVRKGFIGAQITIYPLFKVQRVDFRQTAGQRRRNLAHLTIHLASHSLKIPYMNADDARWLRDQTIYHVESSDRAWY